MREKTMYRDQIRQAVTSEFYQSLADSGVEITAIPQAQLQALVRALADGMFAAMDAVEAEAYGDTAPEAMVAAEAVANAATGEEEQLLWRGRPYMSIGVRYELTSQRLRVIRGEIELVRVRDTKVKQHPGERAINVGDITIISNDPSTPETVLHNVRKPLEVRELIRHATLDEKNRRGLHYREEM
jgi:hypothetical protein